jgi:hypothetical protein
MTPQEAISVALKIHATTKDPLLLDSVRLLHELITDLHCHPDHEPTPLQSAALRLVENSYDATRVLGIDL